MFNISDFLAGDYRIEPVEVKVGRETFLIRRMDGLERLEFSDMKKSADRLVYTLGHCLLDGKTGQPVGERNARTLAARCDALAGELATQIFRLTTDSVKAEEAEWGIAEKNSPETGTSGSTGSTADATA